jgi:hypothetical protein
MNTITSNTEQIVIENAGTGPALKVTQTGPQPIADFYDDNNVLALRIADGGNIGIGSTTPGYKLDVSGNAFINGPLIVNNTITAPTFSGTATQVSQNLTRGTYLTGNNYNGSVATSWAVDADSANTANKVVVRDASGNFSAGTITANLTGTSTQVSQNLTRGTYLTGNNYNGSVATTWAVDADNANTANKVVVRDASGNFSAGTITANLTGTATQVSQNLTRGTYLTGNNYNGSIATTWAVDADTSSIANKVVARDDSGYIFTSGVGIGTTSARELLDIQEGNAIVSGNIGIGTTIATAALDVNRIRLVNTNTYGQIQIARQFDSGYNISLEGTGVTGSTAFRIRNTSGTNNGTAFEVGADTIRFYTNGNTNATEKMRLDLSGNVGIGSTAPAYKLDVSGNAYITGPLTVSDAIIANLTGTATQVSENLTRGTYLTGNNYNGSVATTWEVDADTSVTANKIVARDAFGNIYAANIGIGTDTLNVSLEVWSSNAILLPKGISSDRPIGVQGYIRYNTESQQFEGFGAGNQWGSLGGVKSVAGDTYILAEYSAGNDDKALHFYTNGVEQMILNSNGNVGIGTLTPLRPLHVEEGAIFINGNVGIGTTIPNYTLDINGDMNVTQLYTTSLSLSNLTVTGSYFLGGDSQSIRNTLQLNPLRITNKLDNSSTSNFVGVYTGIYKATPENTEVYLNGYKLAYANTSNKDYDISYSLDTLNNQSIYTVSLVDTPNYGDVVDIIIWPQYLDPNGMLQPGYVLQNIDLSYWEINNVNSNIYYTNGNIGIGTTVPLEKLSVYGNASIGKGLIGEYNQYVGGPFFKQSGWNTSNSSHTVSFPDYCVAENSSGTLNIQVKSTLTNKLGNSSVSFLKAYGNNVELFNTFYHKTTNLSTFTIAASTNDIIITTDNDCSISWTSIGSC